MTAQRDQAFSLIEILVCTAIIAILGALIFPWAKSMQDSARSTQCISNLRQIGVGVALYAAEHNGKFPPLPSTFDDYYSAYTIWSTPGGVRQWVYMGKLFEEGYLKDGRVFFCPTAKKGTFDYESQWAKNVSGTNVINGFRIGYLQRVVDTAPVPGVLPSMDGKAHILMTDNFRARDYSQHPFVQSGESGKRRINVLYSDGRVSTDTSGNRWAHQLTGSLYDEWEKNP